MTAPVAAAVATRAGAGAAAARAGAGKVIDVTPTATRPLKATKVRSSGGRASDAATGAGLSNLLGGGGGKSAPGPRLPESSARKLLIAEFVLCMVILAFSPLAAKHKDDTPASFMKRSSATMGLFFILALVSTAGKGPARAAAGFGGIVTVVLLISQRSVLTVLTAKLGKGVGEEESDPDAVPGGAEEADSLGEVIGDVADQLNGRITPLQPAGPLGNGIR